MRLYKFLRDNAKSIIGDNFAFVEIGKVITNLKTNRTVLRDRIADGDFIRNSNWVGTISKRIFTTLKYAWELPNEWVRGIINLIFKKNDIYMV